ncbi:MAG: hypothetical protein DSY90_07935 [Deltaproteobacteria bacterium]|nr:MAG: hypothetical protein DSY90_07935 [Deltaproteobacteria bacterium]
MEPQRLTGRQIKAKILSLFRQDDFDHALAMIRRLPPRQVVNPLFSFFYHIDEQIRWRAIIAMGVVVAEMAETDPESARVVMRRLMWNLNDESGGVGWGSPEAMGEILARSPLLAAEFSHILVSYLREDMNYLEHEGLQRGLLWGLARLAERQPTRVLDAVPYLVPYTHAADPVMRGLAAKAITAVGGGPWHDVHDRLHHDFTRLNIWTGGRICETTVANLASRPDEDS